MCAKRPPRVTVSPGRYVPAHKSMRIVHAERDAMYAGILRRLLQERGHSAVHVTRSDQLLEVVSRERPDVVVLGLCLDPDDGFEALRLLREHPEIGETPVVVLTAMGSREDVQRCLALGATGYLVKQHHTPEGLIAQITACAALPSYESY